MILRRGAIRTSNPESEHELAQRQISSEAQGIFATQALATKESGTGFDSRWQTEKARGMASISRPGSVAMGAAPVAEQIEMVEERAIWQGVDAIWNAKISSCIAPTGTGVEGF